MKLATMKMKAMKTLGIAAVAGAALAVAAPAAQAQRVYFGVRARGPVYVAPVPPPVVYVGPGYYYGPHRVWVAPRRFHHHY